MSTSNRRCVISGQNQMFIRDNNVREIRNTDINNDAIAMREVDCRSRRENDAIATRDRNNDSRCRRNRDRNNDFVAIRDRDRDRDNDLVAIRDRDNDCRCRCRRNRDNDCECRCRRDRDNDIECRCRRCC